MSASPAVEAGVLAGRPVERNGTSELHGTHADRLPRYLEPGASTAVESNVAYRLSKLREWGVLRGAWLDAGCASGGYTVALARQGADEAVGIDLEPDRIARAQADRPPELTKDRKSVV